MRSVLVARADIRATLGTTGIMVRDTPPELDYSTPTTGAASGAWNALKLLEEMSRGRLYYGGLLFLPLFGIGGAMIGGKAGESDEWVEAVASAETNLREAWAGMKVAEGIRDRVFQHARDRTRHAVRLLPAPDAPEPDAAAAHAALAAQGVTTVLEVRVPEVALVADRAGHNAPITYA